ncbi:helix-turn-helix domain-containing protein [Aquabacterium sp. OR-4]|uniref:helix-turn-helix domain-containing protein n=1 Tax=Aquabacterium sp. OR-4 TaxID=2978127 RepID=UPI0021B3EA12|nr:helix-turn-helix domain-containing protein [Aquabacterium sp. OR-4]MDT7838242.1 helix-turn-helix domain-containing protein [Aquabacterium sp. OR-4]
MNNKTPTSMPCSMRWAMPRAAASKHIKALESAGLIWRGWVRLRAEYEQRVTA